MKAIVKQIHKLLIKNNLKLGVAESCTGGLLSELLTRLPGSSEYFILGLITYSNEAKIRLLKIPASLIIKKGAVSKEVALRMAESVKKLVQADCSIGITGIAGPAGGSKIKPVGTVFIAVRAKNKIICRKFIFKGKRLRIQRKAALESLALLKKLLK